MTTAVAKTARPEHARRQTRTNRETDRKDWNIVGELPKKGGFSIQQIWPLAAAEITSVLLMQIYDNSETKTNIYYA